MLVLVLVVSFCSSYGYGFSNAYAFAYPNVYAYSALIPNEDNIILVPVRLFSLSLCLFLCLCCCCPRCAFAYAYVHDMRYVAFIPSEDKLPKRSCSFKKMFKVLIAVTVRTC